MIITEYYFFIIVSFIIGTAVGSFLKVVADRGGLQYSIKGRSHCDVCKRRLDALDLIPILSYIVSRGKCRSCGAKLSIWYPISELITGLVFAFIYAMFYTDLLLVLILCLVASFILVKLFKFLK